MGKKIEKKYRNFFEARSYVRNLELKNLQQWKKFSRTKFLPDDIPHNPDEVYTEWINYYDWLGIKEKEIIEENLSISKAQQLGTKTRSSYQLLTDGIIKDRNGNTIAIIEIKNNKPLFDKKRIFEQLKKYARSLNLENKRKWQKHFKENINIIGLGFSNPNLSFKDKGWKSWGDFLGNYNLERKSRDPQKYLTYEESSKHIQALNIKNNEKMEKLNELLNRRLAEQREMANKLYESKTMFDLAIKKQEMCSLKIDELKPALKDLNSAEEEIRKNSPSNQGELKSDRVSESIQKMRSDREKQLKSTISEMEDLWLLKNKMGKLIIKVEKEGEIIKRETKKIKLNTWDAREKQRAIQKVLNSINNMELKIEDTKKKIAKSKELFDYISGDEFRLTFQSFVNDLKEKKSLVDKELINTRKEIESLNKDIQIKNAFEWRKFYLKNKEKLKLANNRIIPFRPEQTYDEKWAGFSSWSGYNLKNLNKPILKEWYHTKNKKEGLFPENITPYSHQQVWWKCEKNHVWKSSVKQRINSNKGCPECDYLKKLIFDPLNSIQPR